MLDAPTSALNDQQVFLKELCACRTIRIVVGQGAFVGQGSSYNVIYKLLVGAISKQIDPVSVKPAILTSEVDGTDAATFVKRLVEATGPFFIILDEAGRGFQDPRGDAESRKLFMDFTANVLARWMATPKIYFVLLRHLSFLRERKRLFPDSPYRIVRLPLTVIHREKIKVILSETRTTCGSSETLQQRWNLSSSEDLETAASWLFTASAGIPRKICRLLADHPTYSGFLEYVKGGYDLSMTSRQREELYRNVQLWQLTLMQWIGEDPLQRPTINLLKPVKDCGDREVPATLVLDRCRLHWEGTLEEARLVAHDTIWNMVIGVLSPLHAYATGLQTVLPYMTGVHPEVVKWMFLKRMQELFSSKKTPRTKLPFFFGGATWLDDFAGISFSKRVDPLPKITLQYKHVPQTVSLDSKMANPEAWPRLMKLMLDRLAEIPSGVGLCLKPPPQSSSADVLFVARRGSFVPEPTKKKKKKKRQRVDSTGRTLILGLAVKTCTNSAMGRAEIFEECVKFEMMCEELDTLKYRVGSVTGVLIVCATRYTSEIQASFGASGSTSFVSPKPLCFNHVLLLNVATPDMRARFFGFSEQPALKQVVEDVIAKPKQNSA